MCAIAEISMVFGPPQTQFPIFFGYPDSVYKGNAHALQLGSSSKETVLQCGMNDF